MSLDREISAHHTQQLVNRAVRQIKKRLRNNLYIDIEDTLAAHGSRGPGGFIAETMLGFDPRSKVSTARAIVERIESRGPTEMPTESEWFELADAIKTDPRYNKEPVEFTVSMQAANKLADILQKSDSDTDISSGNPEMQSPLTAAECEIFDAWFAEKYGG